MSTTLALLNRIDALRNHVAAAVAAQRDRDPAPDDPYRGLYVAEHHVDEVLRGSVVSEAGSEDGTAGTGDDLLDRIEALAARADLDHLDVGLLLAALAPDVDDGFEKLYVYLNDDITRRRASVGIALDLAGASRSSPAARARLMPGAPLVDLRLVEVEDADRPFLTRGLRVPDRVTQHLLGSDTLPGEVAGLTIATAEWPERDEALRWSAAFRTGRGFLHLHDPADAGGVDLGAAILRSAGLEPLCIDLGRAPVTGVDADPVVREAYLRGVAVVVRRAERATPELLRALVEHTPAVITVSHDGWEPSVAARTPLSLRVAAPGFRERRESWSSAVGRAEADVDVAALDSLRISPSGVHATVAVASRLAELDGARLSIGHVRDAARMHASSRLDRLARRIVPCASWGDLVLNRTTRADLELLVLRIRHSERVLDDWGLRRRSGHAEGVTALFAGGSGTGKTLAAEVVAAELGLDLYVIDLSTVVDKYVGETEKNLERIFAEAEGINGILFFDEADALFGKRSEVSDARDRYANTEIAYLLQRIETFDGLAILATNLKANVDEAFLRRLAAVVDFPDPDIALRRSLWDLHLQPVPCADDVDLDFAARAFELTGGNIRNVAVTASFIAVARGGVVSMADLVRAIALEYRKLGRLCDEAEFGAWTSVVADGWKGERAEVA